MTDKTTNDNALPWSTDASPNDGGNGLLERLAIADRDFGPKADQNDRAIALIAACIGEGVCTDGHIIAVLKPLGLGRKHIGAVLTKSTGIDPKRHCWRKDNTGTYSLLDRDAVPESLPSAAHISVPKVAGASATTP